MTPEEVNRNIDEAFQSTDRIGNVIRKGVMDAVQHYATAGELMATWAEGKVVWVDPLQILEEQRRNAGEVQN